MQEYPSKDAKGLMEIIIDNDGRTPLKEYIEKGTLLEDEMKKKKIKHKTAWFIVINNELYKRTKTKSTM